MVLLNRIAGRTGKRTLVVLLLVLLSAFAGLAQAQANSSIPSAAVNTATPDKVAYDFYVWYLKEMLADHNPVGSKAQPLCTYVSAALLAEIDKKMRSPDGMDEDYFMRAQDYTDSWATHIETSHLTVNGATATVLVTLGAGPNKDDIWKLKVTLIKDGQIWKIRRVAQG